MRTRMNAFFSSSPSFPSVRKGHSIHPDFLKADRLSRELIGAAIEVHRALGPGLLESIYERCLIRELEIRGIPSQSQERIQITYFYCPLVFIECKVLWDNLFGVLINQEGNLPWMVGLRFGWTN